MNRNFSGWEVSTLGGRMKNSIQRTLGAFTMIELLVVISIIAVLVAIMLPAIQLVRFSAKELKCGQNMSQIGVAFQAYAAENDGRLPPHNIASPVGPFDSQTWDEAVAQYFGVDLPYDVLSASNPTFGQNYHIPQLACEFSKHPEYTGTRRTLWYNYGRRPATSGWFRDAWITRGHTQSQLIPWSGNAALGVTEFSTGGVVLLSEFTEPGHPAHDMLNGDPTQWWEHSLGYTGGMMAGAGSFQPLASGPKSFHPRGGGACVMYADGRGGVFKKWNEFASAFNYQVTGDP